MNNLTAPPTTLVSRLQYGLRYKQLVREFAQSGRLPDALQASTDSLDVYLSHRLIEAMKRYPVSSSRIARQICADSLSQFVEGCVDKCLFETQRLQAEIEQMEDAAGWSLDKQRACRLGLIDQIKQKHPDADFHEAFYRRRMTDATSAEEEEGLWLSMIGEWREAILNHLNARKERIIAARSERFTNLLELNMKQAPQYVAEHQVGEEEFLQTWGLMEGRWNVVEFERLHRVALLQHRYHALVELANRMGRITDPTGNKTIMTGWGDAQQLVHSGKSDIEGISLGNDLNEIIPSEMATLLDNELDDVFYKKYAMHALQTFHSKSQMLHTARQLRQQPARLMGPMIVCVDTSGSMMGEATKIALSALMRLLRLCDESDRDIFVIGFTDMAHPIDVRNERAKLLQFLSRPCTGNTDARRMLATTMELIRTSERFCGADVLIISDFRMPTPPADFLNQLTELREQGCRFYGLQLGIAVHDWLPVVDELFQIADIRAAVR